MLGALQLVIVRAGGTNVNLGTEQTVNEAVALLGRKKASPAKLTVIGKVPAASAGVSEHEAPPPTVVFAMHVCMPLRVNERIRPTMGVVPSSVRTPAAVNGFWKLLKVAPV